MCADPSSRGKRELRPVRSPLPWSLAHDHLQTRQTAPRDCPGAALREPHSPRSTLRQQPGSPVDEVKMSSSWTTPWRAGEMTFPERRASVFSRKYRPRRRQPDHRVGRPPVFDGRVQAGASTNSALGVEIDPIARSTRGPAVVHDDQPPRSTKRSSRIDDRFDLRRAGTRRNTMSEARLIRVLSRLPFCPGRPPRSPSGFP